MKRASGPRLSSGEVVGWTPEKEATAYNLEQKYGLPEGTLRGMSYRESQFGKLPNRPGSQYQSEFQLGRPIRSANHVTDTRNFSQTAEAAAKFAAQNKNELQSKLGREPTREELYMGHQQGSGGAAKLISHPNASAASQISSRFANANGGRGLTSQQFIDKHSRAFNEGINKGADQLWADNKGGAPQLGDKQQLAMRGDQGSVSDVMMAALEKAQPTQMAKADNLPVWAKTQVASVQRDLPKSDTLSRINPKDPSGPLLGDKGPTQLADVVGKGIPASNMQTPGMNPKLEQPTMMAALTDVVGKGVPASSMQTPGLNPQLEQPTQMAQLDMSAFGKNVPASGMGTPGLNPTLEQPTQLAMADAPMPPSRPSGLEAATTNAPLPPSRPDFSTPPAPVQVAQHQSPVVQHMAQLSEPVAAPTGGVEGFASASPVVAMNSPQQMGGEFDIASLFGDAFAPQQGSFMMADAQPQMFGGDFGGDMGGFGGGFDLGSLFG